MRKKRRSLGCFQVLVEKRLIGMRSGVQDEGLRDTAVSISMAEGAMAGSAPDQ